MDRYYNCDDKGIVYRNAINLSPDLYRTGQLSYALDSLIDVEERVETIDTINTEVDWGLFKEEIRIIKGELKGIENLLVLVIDDLKEKCYIKGGLSNR